MTDLYKAAKMGLDALKYHQDQTRPIQNTIEVIAALQKTLDRLEPQVCCGDYEKCMEPCTPRGRWLANQQMTRLKQEKGQFVGGVPSVSQQREWVGLTNEEIADGQAEGEARSFRSAVRWVEAKLREKNA